MSEKQKQYIGTLFSEVSANGKSPTLTERIERILRIVFENSEKYLSIDPTIIEQLTKENTTTFSFWTFDETLFMNIKNTKICNTQSKTTRYLLFSYLASNVEIYKAYKL